MNIRDTSSRADKLPGKIDEQIDRQIREALEGKSVDQWMQEASSPSTGAVARPSQPSEEETGSSEVPYELQRGRIDAISGDDVFVKLSGIEAKLQGIVPLKQFDRPPRIGSIMDFVVERHDESEGLIHLSREGAISQATWQQLQKGTIVEARVTATNTGGLELEMIGGIRAFMPASQIDLRHIDELEPLVGQTLRAVVQEINRRGRTVVLSRKRHLEHERRAKREKLLKELDVGQTRQGTVTNIVDFGAFVDLGGLDGLVHISDMSYSRIEKPADVVSVGQAVTVRVLKIDREQNRIRLGLKQVKPDPWDAIDQQLHAGDHVAGRVVRTTNFGAFVEIEAGVEGLLPISEISWKRIKSPSATLSAGDVLQLKVLRIDAANQRLSLSLKQAQADPWSDIAEKYPCHDIVEATVQHTTEYGAFVELEPGVEGLVHISELSDRRVEKVSDVVEVSQKHQFRVMQIDAENRRIKLSLKAVKHPPAEARTAATESSSHGSDKTPAAAQPAKSRKKAENLFGGLGTGGGMGQGLRELKL